MDSSHSRTEFFVAISVYIKITQHFIEETIK